MNITYGNKEGRWPIEHLFQALEELAQLLSVRLGVEDFRLWYDDPTDFHHMSFEHLGVLVDIRLYKVFSVQYDGEEAKGWNGWRHHQLYDFIHSLQKNIPLYAQRKTANPPVGTAQQSD